MSSQGSQTLRLVRFKKLPTRLTVYMMLGWCPAGSSDAASASQAVVSLLEARKLAGPILANSAGAPPAAAPTAKAAKGAPKADVAQGLIPARAVAQLKQAAEACEAVMSKLSSANSAPGLLSLQSSVSTLAWPDISWCNFRQRAAELVPHTAVQRLKPRRLRFRTAHKSSSR